MTRAHRFLAPACLLALAAPALAQAQAPAPDVHDYYRIEKIAAPDGVDPQVGGIAALPDGRIAASFHSGDVYFYDPRAAKWTRFADGLHEPLGIVPLANDRLVIVQKPELTLVSDTDGDGRADRFEALSDDFGFSGNYHEFAFGPVRDRQGNYYIALNTASTGGGGISEEVRGDFRSLSATRAQVAGNRFPNKMFSVVPYRGWVLKVTPEGKTIPWASGFRSPNGLALDGEGRLFVTDNQGDWLGTSKMYHVEQGGFYGHPVSLIWKQGWEGDPLQVDPVELDRMRTREVVAFPHELFANSPTQPILIPEGFGPFGGQLLVGEMNHPRLLRVMLEEVAGALQGAVVHFMDGLEVGLGNNRLAFAPDGSLWVGKMHLKWAGATGLHRIVPTGRVPMDIRSMKLTERGFDLEFTHPVDRALAADPSSYRVRRYYYAYHQSYGSPQRDVGQVAVTRTRVSDDGRRVRVELAELQPGYQYEMDLAGYRAADGTPLLNPLVAYTVNRLLDGTTPPPGFGVERTAGSPDDTEP